MSLVVRAVSRHLPQPDGTHDVKTMIVSPGMTPEEFKSKLEIKIKDTLPEGSLSFAADLGEPETALVDGSKIFEIVKAAGLTKCVIFFTPVGFKGERVMKKAAATPAAAADKPAAPTPTKKAAAPVEAPPSASAEAVCGHCETVNKVGYKFCRRCGTAGPVAGGGVDESAKAAVTAPKAEPAKADSSNCVNCGSDNKPGARFCRKCGKPPTGEAPAAVKPKAAEVPPVKVAAATATRESSEKSPRQSGSKSPKAKAVPKEAAAAATSADGDLTRESTRKKATKTAASKTAKAGAKVADAPVKAAADETFCPDDDCKAKNPVGYKFCAKCGAPAPKSAAAASVAAAPVKKATEPDAAVLWSALQEWVSEREKEADATLESAEAFGVPELAELIDQVKERNVGFESESAKRVKDVVAAVRANKGSRVGEADVAALAAKLKTALEKLEEDLEDRMLGLRARAKKEAVDKVNALWTALKAWCDQTMAALDEVESKCEGASLEQLQALLKQTQATAVTAQQSWTQQSAAVLQALSAAMKRGAKPALTEAQVAAAGNSIVDAQKTAVEDVLRRIRKAESTPKVDTAAVAGAKWAAYREWAIGKMTELDQATESAEDFGLAELTPHLERTAALATQVSNESRQRADEVVAALKGVTGAPAPASEKDVLLMSQRLEDAQSNAQDDIRDRIAGLVAREARLRRQEAGAKAKSLWETYKMWVDAKLEALGSADALPSTADELRAHADALRESAAELASANERRSSALLSAVRDAGEGCPVTEPQVQALSKELLDAQRAAQDAVAVLLEKLSNAAPATEAAAPTISVGDLWVAYEGWTRDQLDALDEAAEAAESMDVGQLESHAARVNGLVKQVSAVSAERARALLDAIGASDGSVGISAEQVAALQKKLLDAQKTSEEDVEGLLQSLRTKRAAAAVTTAASLWDTYQTWVSAKLETLDAAVAVDVEQSAEELDAMLTGLRDTNAEISGANERRSAALFAAIGDAGEASPVQRAQVQELSDKLSESQRSAENALTQLLKERQSAGGGGGAAAAVAPVEGSQATRDVELAEAVVAVAAVDDALPEEPAVALETAERGATVASVTPVPEETKPQRQSERRSGVHIAAVESVADASEVEALRQKVRELSSLPQQLKHLEEELHETETEMDAQTERWEAMVLTLNNTLQVRNAEMQSVKAALNNEMERGRLLEAQLEGAVSSPATALAAVSAGGDVEALSAVRKELDDALALLAERDAAIVALQQAQSGATGVDPAKAIGDDKVASLEQQLAKMKDILKSSEEEIVQLSDDLAESETRLAAAREQLASAPRGDDTAAEVAQLKEALAAAEAQVVQLSDELVKQVEAGPRVVSPSAPVASEVEELKAALAAALAQSAPLASEVARLKKSLTEAEGEINDLSDDLAEAETRLAKAQQQAPAAGGDGALAEEVLELKEALAAAEARAQSQQSVPADAAALLAAAEQQIAGLSADLEALAIVDEQSHAQLAALKAQLEQHAADGDKIVALEAELATLKASLGANASREGVVDDTALLKEALAAAEQQVASLSADLEALAASEDDSRERIAELTAKLESATASGGGDAGRAAALEAEVTALKEALAAAEQQVAGLTADLDMLAGTDEQTQAELADLRAQVQAHQSGGSGGGDDGAKLEALETEIAALRDALAVAQQKQDGSDSGSRTAELEAQVIALQTSLATAEQQAGALTADLEALAATDEMSQAQIDQLQKELDELRQQQQQQQRDVAAVDMERAAQLEQEVAALKAALEEAKLAAAGAETSAALAQENASLRERVDHLFKLSETMERENAEQITVLQEKEADVEEQLATLTKDLEVLDGANASLRAELGALKQGSVAKATEDALRAEIADQAQRAALELAALKEAHSTQVEELMRDLELVTASDQETEALRAQLAALQASHDASAAELAAHVESSAVLEAHIASQHSTITALREELGALQANSEAAARTGDELTQLRTAVHEVTTARDTLGTLLSAADAAHAEALEALHAELEVISEARRAAEDAIETTLVAEQAKHGEQVAVLSSDLEALAGADIEVEEIRKRVEEQAVLAQAAQVRISELEETVVGSAARVAELEIALELATVEAEARGGLDTELEAMKTQLASVQVQLEQQTAAAAAEVAALTATYEERSKDLAGDVDTLVEEAADLKGQLEVLQIAHDEAQVELERVRASVATAEQRAAALDAEKAALVKAHEAQVAELTRDLDALVALDGELETLRAAHASQGVELAAAQAEVQRLQGAGVSSEEIERVQSEKAAVVAQLEAVSKQRAALQSELNALKVARDEHVAVLSNDLEALVSVDLDNASLREQLSKAEERVATLQDDLAKKILAIASAAAAAERENAEQRRLTEEHEAAVAALTAEVAAGKEALTRVRGEATTVAQRAVEEEHTRRVAVSAELNARTAELAEAQAALAKATAERDAATKASHGLTQERAQLTTALEVASAKLRDLEAQHASLLSGSDAHKSTLQQQLEALNKQLAAERAAATALAAATQADRESRAAKEAELAAALAAAEAARAALVVAHEEALRSAVEHRDAVSRELDTVKAAQQTNEEQLQQQLAALRALEKQHSDKVKAMQSEIDVLKAICDDQAADITSDSEARAALSKEASALRAKVQAADAAAAVTQARVAALTAEVQAAKVAHDELLKSKADVTAQLESQLVRTAELESELQKQSAVAAQQRDEAKRTIEDLTRDVEGLALIDEETQLELEQSKAAAETLRARVAELEAQMQSNVAAAALQTQLDEQTSAHAAALAAQQQLLDDAKADLAAAQEAAREAKNAGDTRIRALESEMAILQGIVEDLSAAQPAEGAMAALEADKLALVGQLDARSRAALALEAEKAALVVQLEERARAIHGLETDKQALAVQLETRSAAVAAAEAKAASLEASLETLTLEKSTVAASHAEALRHVSEKLVQTEAERIKAVKQAELLKTSSGAMAGELATARAALASAPSVDEVETLRARVAQLTTALATAGGAGARAAPPDAGAVAEGDETPEELRRRLEETEDLLVDLQDELDLLQIKMREMMENPAVAAAVAGEVAPAVVAAADTTALTTRLAETEARLVDVEARLAAEAESALNMRAEYEEMEAMLRDEIERSEGLAAEKAKLENALERLKKAGTSTAAARVAGGSGSIPGAGRGKE